MGGLRLRTGGLPAFHYRNDLGIELLRAKVNLPLLQCDDATLPPPRGARLLFDSDSGIETGFSPFKSARLN
jgi:hypothetical protein